MYNFSNLIQTCNFHLSIHLFAYLLTLMCICYTKLNIEMMNMSIFSLCLPFHWNQSSMKLDFGRQSGALWQVSNAWTNKMEIESYREGVSGLESMWGLLLASIENILTWSVIPCGRELGWMDAVIIFVITQQQVKNQFGLVPQYITSVSIMLTENSQIILEEKKFVFLQLWMFV